MKLNTDIDISPAVSISFSGSSYAKYADPNRLSMRLEDVPGAVDYLLQLKRSLLPAPGCLDEIELGKSDCAFFAREGGVPYLVSGLNSVRSCRDASGPSEPQLAVQKVSDVTTEQFAKCGQAAPPLVVLSPTKVSDGISEDNTATRLIGRIGQELREEAVIPAYVALRHVTHFVV